MQTLWNRRLIAMTVAVLALAATRPGAAVELAAQLQSERIYLGTQTVLVAAVSDADSPDWPTVASVDGLKITRYGSPSRMTSLINGTLQRSTRFSFMIQPERAGTFTIPSVTFDDDGDALEQGPFTLRVIEAALEFRGAEIEPNQLLVGETARLTLEYEGVRPDMRPTIPQVPGLVIRAVGAPRVQPVRRGGVPVSTYNYQVRASRIGDYTIKGIELDGVAAGTVELRVGEFVVVGTRVDSSSLEVDGQTILHVLVRGLDRETALSLVAPEGLTVTPSAKTFRGPPGVTVFSFDVVATAPGTPTITTLKLPDGRQVPLNAPVRFSVRQSGESGILVHRAKPRRTEVTLGEPFIVDFEMFVRGDLRALQVDMSDADFARQPYNKVEPVNELSYEGWDAEALLIPWGEDGRMAVLSGSGELEGQAEQLLRFALRITPLAAGELDLSGIRAAVGLFVEETKRTAVSVFRSSRTERFDCTFELPTIQVMDPPGVSRPRGYRGAVGKSFTFVTELDRQRAAAMSPLTLTMKITGETVGPQFDPPRLTDIPELTRDFDVSPTVQGGEVVDQTITLSQVVRPRSDSVTELPALPLVFYDYEAKRYETVYSMPIPIEVTPGSLVGAGAMQTAAREESEPRAETASALQDEDAVTLGANHTTLGHVVRPAPLSTAGTAVALCAGPMAILLVWLGQTWQRRRQPVARTRRQRSELLDKLKDLDGGDGFYIRLADVVHSYLRVTLDLPSGEVAPASLASALEQRDVDDGLKQETLDLLERCDTGRFTAGQVDWDERANVLDHAREVLMRLDRHL